MVAIESPSLDVLRSKMRAIEGGALDRQERVISSAFREVDAWLPKAGFAVGSFVEVLHDGVGTGAYSLALKWGSAAAHLKSAWAVLDSESTFNPCATASQNADLQKLILVRASSQDAGWCFTQLLGSKDIGACFWATSSMDNMVFRRLQLAAERGGGLGFVMRPLSALRKPCWGSLRIQIFASGANKVRLRLLHARGQPNAVQSEIEIEA